MPRILEIIGITVCLLMLSTMAGAQITVNSVIHHFKSGSRPVKNVTIFNSAPEALYVEVNVREVLDPQEGGSKTIETDALLASPKTFSVEPNGERTVRLLLRSPPGDHERIFRVTFAPQDRGFANEVIKKSGNQTAVIRVLSGMGILVFADPANPKADLTWERTATQIIFSNNGNQHVQLADGESCTAKGEQCLELQPKRVYGGQSYTIGVAGDRLVKFQTRSGATGEYGPLEIPPKI